MKILIVNYFSKPVTGAHVYRWSQLSEYWAGLGYEVFFLTSRYSLPDTDNLSGIRYIRVGFNRYGGNIKLSTDGDASFKRVILNTLKWVRRKIFWPDGYWGWLPFVIRDIFLLRNQNFDLIVSYSPSFCAHVAGLIFKKIFGGRGQWIADYGDPFSISETMPPNNFKIYRLLNRFVEKKVLDNADKITFTNESTRLEYRKCFGPGDFEVIPHVVDISDFYSQDIYRKNKPRILYIGGFHKNIREPNLMVTMMNKVGEILGIRTEVYGPLNGFKPEELCAEFVQYRGPLERGDAISHLRGNCILINVENDDCVMTPSKIVELLATGNPVINFYTGQRSDLFLVSSFEDNVCHIDNLEQVDDLIGFITRKINTKLERKIVEFALDEFTLASVSDNYLSITGVSK